MLLLYFIVLVWARTTLTDRTIIYLFRLQLAAVTDSELWLGIPVNQYHTQIKTRSVIHLFQLQKVKSTNASLDVYPLVQRANFRTHDKIR